MPVGGWCQCGKAGRVVDGVHRGDRLAVLRVGAVAQRTISPWGEISVPEQPPLTSW
jgi:hypothetical protein